MSKIALTIIGLQLMRPCLANQRPLCNLIQKMGSEHAEAVKPSSLKKNKTKQNKKQNKTKKKNRGKKHLLEWM